MSTARKRLTSLLALAGLGMTLCAAAGAVPHHPDFNGDGFADLAVSAPGEDFPPYTDAGAVHVIYGSLAGLNAANTQIIDEAHLVIPGGISGYQIGARFGEVLAWGDFNGDGYDDLA